ncbi:MAG: DUF222 domain-containing protein [Pseudonocardiaceae bacterium]
MFDTVIDVEVSDADALRDEDWFDPAWLEQIPEPEDLGQIPAAQCAPSGWLALELDHATADPARLSDTGLIDTIVGFERVSSWASARQARLLAEFARRRPDEDAPPDRRDTPTQCSGFAPDEVALALRLSRTTAANRMTMARVLEADLPGTLAAWQSGTIDDRKARAITETSYLLPAQQRTALEERVLPRAGGQTLAQLRAALARAVLAIDPQGVADRHEQRRKDRRVVLSPEEDGMANLWALLSAPDAAAAYQRLCRLARSLGAEDPRGMDARRADLLVELLTGRRCAATSAPLDDNCTPLDDNCTPLDGSGCAHPGGVHGCEGTFAEGTSAEEIPGTAFDPSGQDATDQGTADQGTGRRPPHDCAPTRSGAGTAKPLVSVIVPISTLLGLDQHPGELVGYGPIPAHLAREIAAEGTWRRLLTDPASGVLLDHGRTTYTPPAGLADFVRARDVYCRHPGCGQRAATADLDHHVPWPDGPTSAHNLYAYCRHHHLTKTLAPGWRVDQHPDDTVTWTTPTGHTYTSHPTTTAPTPRH